jgi:hypothetical protein
MTHVTRVRVSGIPMIRPVAGFGGLLQSYSLTAPAQSQIDKHERWRRAAATGGTALVSTLVDAILAFLASTK